MNNELRKVIHYSFLKIQKKEEEIFGKIKITAMAKVVINKFEEAKIIWISCRYFLTRL